MKKEEFKILMEDVLGIAKTHLTKDGKLLPVAFIKYDDNIDIIALSFGDNAEKDECFSILRGYVKKNNADAILVLVESWYVVTNSRNVTIEPSKDPTRKECIMIMGEHEEERVTLVQTFDRKDGKENGEIVFGEKINAGDVSSAKFHFGIKGRKKQNENLRDLS